MAEDNDSDDQLDDFIHSYSYSDSEEAHTRRSSDDEDASCSDDSGSKPPGDLSDAEAEDMDFYDLYTTSACPSPQPPASPALKCPGRELDSVPEDPSEEPKGLHAEWRKCTCGQAPACLNEVEGHPDAVARDSCVERTDDGKKTGGQETLVHG
ncbi:hypothetical protein C8R46DRAFT_237808 [Mycena filopes]|nr:hypothetical protein C8R46DRAFT_237808 [Mycena filopes]